MVKVSAEEILEGAERELERGRKVRICARGGSMEPFVREGDVVVLERRERYVTDDIVLALTDCGVMLHAVMPDGRLMGTANLERRERVVRTAGCVVSVERGGRVRETGSRSWRAGMAAWRLALPVRRVLMRLIKFRRK